MRNFVFDLYGTLIDIRTDEEDVRLYERMAFLYRCFGAVYSPVEMKRTYFRMIREEQEKIGGQWPEPDLRAVFIRMLKEKGGSCRNESAWAEQTGKIFRMFSLRRRRLYPGAEELLQKLKQDGFGIYLLSNAQSVFTLPELRQTGIERYFDGIFISSDYHVKKPSPEFAGHLFREAGITPQSCVIIGNDFSSDMRTAAVTGMKGIYINSDGREKKQIEELRKLYNETAETRESICELTEEEYYAGMAE